MSKTCWFVDTETGKLYGEGCDRRGTDLVGEDADGFWWGTPFAPWCLSEGAAMVCVEGRRGATHCTYFFLGTRDEAVDYVERRGVRVTHVEIGAPREFQ
jgi:hypothetical protein